MRIRHTGASTVLLLFGVLVAAIVIFSAYIWVMLQWSYSEGERAGWVQKFSKKGWVCKTWEGEMAMVSLPGSMPEKFLFSVQDDAVASQINGVIGKRHYTGSLQFGNFLGLSRRTSHHRGRSHAGRGLQLRDPQPGFLQ